VYSKAEPEILSCEAGKPGFSFYFDLIAPIWRNCQAEGAVHRLCSLMRKMGAKTLLREALEPNEEIGQESEDLETRVGKSLRREPQAFRFSFFSASCPEKNQWREQLPRTSFLGYAVILKAALPTDVPIVAQRCRSGQMAHVLEAVTRPPGWAVENDRAEYTTEGVTNYYVHCQRKFETTVGPRGASKDYSLNGAFFCQQNGLTHVCAHAALRMVFNTADGLLRQKATNRQLNEALGIDHKTEATSLTEDGLSVEQILAICKHFGLNVVGGNFILFPTVDYAQWTYPLVESGYPVLLAFHPTHATGHVVTVIGHTMNSDKWDCEAHLAYRPEAFGTYHASAAWVDHFIINDDNFGMYTCMPPAYLRSRTLPQYDVTERAEFAMAFVPPRIDVPPYFAEKAVIGLLEQFQKVYQPSPGNKWLERIWQQLRQPTKGIVARTLACKKKEYIAHLKAELDSDGKGPVSAIPSALAAPPEDLWLTEISLPDLYTANKHKLGDMLTGAKAGLQGGQPVANFVWGWLPGVEVPVNPQAGGAVATWPLTGHVPVLRPRMVLGPHREW
jgi:hypothetical protein